MATTAPPATPNDLVGVTKTLDLPAPRWSVWVLMTVSSQPLRYAEVKPRLPWLADGQLHPRLRHLTNAGVIERTEYAPRHVTYGLTSRGAALLPVLTVIASWGDTYLEKELVANKHTGEREPERIAPAQNIDDAVALLVPRHATPILWSLQARGTATAKTLASEAMPGYGLTAVAADFDDDGWVDIYVASDSTSSILYHNNHDGTFTDVALPSGAGLSENGMPQAGMGVGVGDFNADGRLDLFKTHFADDIPALYRARGKGLFDDVAVPAGLGVLNRYVEWGAGIADFDILVAKDFGPAFFVHANRFLLIWGSAPGPRCARRSATGCGGFVSNPRCARGCRDTIIRSAARLLRHPSPSFSLDRPPRWRGRGRASRGP